MRALQEFYRIAEQQNISVDLFPLQMREALSLMDSCGDCHIAIDPQKLKGEPDERAKLAHELGHCLTGAFYNRRRLVLNVIFQLGKRIVISFLR